MVGRPHNQKTSHQKVLDQFKLIRDVPESIVRTKSSFDNEYGAHTLFKLALLNYYIGVFFPIAKANFNKIFYVDLLAGSGLVKIRDTDSYVKGSALLAATSKYAFTKLICCEIDEKRATLLKLRLNLLKVPNEVIQGDVNTKMDEIISICEIDKETIILLFVDPEGMEINIDIIKKIVDRTKCVDIMLNYNFGIDRMKARAELYQGEADIQKMRSMAPGYQPGDDPSLIAMDYLKNTLGRQVGRKVDICRDTGRPEYSIIIRTRRTYFGSKWLQSLDSIINYINQCDGQDAARILSQACGSQQVLDV
jgi:three-Cys-motif partner protein